MQHKRGKKRKRNYPQHQGTYPNGVGHPGEMRREMPMDDGEAFDRRIRHGRPSQDQGDFEDYDMDTGQRRRGPTGKRPFNMEDQRDMGPDMGDMGSHGNKRRMPSSESPEIENGIGNDLDGLQEEDEEEEDASKKNSFNEKYSKYYEIIFAVVTCLLIINYIMGKDKTLAYMEKWYSINKEFFDSNYSHLGEDDEYSTKNTFPVKRESVTEFRFYSTGRIYVKWMLVCTYVSIILTFF